jgi:hypothetical protein
MARNADEVAAQTGLACDGKILLSERKEWR